MRAHYKDSTFRGRTQRQALHRTTFWDMNAGKGAIVPGPLYNGHCRCTMKKTTTSSSMVSGPPTRTKSRKR